MKYLTAEIQSHQKAEIQTSKSRFANKSSPMSLQILRLKPTANRKSASFDPLSNKPNHQKGPVPPLCKSLVRDKTNIKLDYQLSYFRIAHTTTQRESERKGGGFPRKLMGAKSYAKENQEKARHRKSISFAKPN